MNKFFTKIATLSVGLAMAIGVGVAIGSKSNEVKPAEATVTNPSEGDVFNQITKASDLTDGCEIIFVNQAKTKVVTTDNGNNRAMADISNITTTWTAPKNSSAVVFKVKKSGTTTISNVQYDNFGFHDGNGYIYRGSSNQLKTDTNAYSTDISGASAWALTGVSSGAFTLVSSNSTSRSLQFYQTSQFAQYSTSQIKPLIYKKATASNDKIDDSSNPFTVTATPTVTRGDSVPDASDWTVTAKLVDKDTPVSITGGLSIVGTPNTSTVGSISVTLRYTAASGDYALNSGNATYDISTSMTVNPVQAEVEFKQATYTIAPNATLTLADEITQSGDGDLSFSITSGSEYVSISNGVLTANALGTATIKVVKQYSTYTAFKAEDTATVEVSNVATWSHTFSSKTIDSSPATESLSGKSWTVTNNGDYYGYDSTKGQQIGSGSYPAKSLTFESSAFESYSEIKTVKVTTNSAASGSVSLSVKVGDTSYKNGSNTSVTISDSTSTEYVFQSTSNDCGKITISWSQSTSKAIYIKKLEVTYDNTPITQGGIKASWDTGKGTYYNGSITATTTFSTEHIIVDTTTSAGKVYGDSNTTGYGFKTYLKNSAGKWVKTDKTTSDTEVVFADSSSAVVTQAMTGFEAGTYSIYVTTPKDGGGVWTSEEINFVVVAKAPETITRASEPSKIEYVAYADTFESFTGKINVSYNDGATDNNRTPVIKYYNGNTEVTISDYLNANNKFAVNTNTTLTVRLYDTGFVDGDYVYNSYSIYVYAGTFACTDGNGSGAEYESGGTVTLNPSPKINYTDKDSAAQVLNLTSSDVDLYIKLKGASGDGELYDGILPEVESETEYTITAVYKGNSSYKASYDITVVNATFLLNATGATKSYAFGTNFTKTGLVVQIQYGSADPVTIDPADYTCEDENGNELDVIKFIGSMTVTVRYKGYSDTYEITGTNVGSSETYVHDDIPGSWELGDSTVSTVSKTNITATSLGGSSRLTKGSVLTFANAYGENTIVGAMSVTFQVKSSSSSNAGATFTFKMTALSGATETENVVTGVQKTLTSSYADVTLSINNISADDEVNGWKIEVTNKANGSGSGQNGNADWDNFSGTHTPYTLGPDQTFNSTPFEQALSYSNYFLELTANYCTVALTTEIKATLADEYNGMVAEAKVVFTSATVVRGKGATYENAISEALSRYVNMVEEKGTGDFLSLGSEVLQKGKNNPVNLVSKNASAVIIIVVISAISVAAIGGYFFFRKKKEN